APKRKLHELRWQQQLKDQLTDLVSKYVGPAGWEKKLIVQLSGPYGTGKKTMASALCSAAGVPLLVVDLPELLRRFSDFDSALRSAFRYAFLSQAAICLDQFDSICAEESRFAACKPILRRCIEEMSSVTFITTEQGWKSGDSFSGLVFVNVELPMPDA